jgi:hypothetical protein
VNGGPFGLKGLPLPTLYVQIRRNGL